MRGGGGFKAPSPPPLADLGETGARAVPAGRPAPVIWYFPGRAVPALVTPFHDFEVVTTLRHTRRHGFADPALVSMMLLSSTSGRRYWPPVPVSSISAARETITSW